MWIDIRENQREEFNSLATHPLQSYEWGEFREKNCIQVIRKGYSPSDSYTSNGAGKLTQAFQMTIHPIPHTSWNIGYIPKGTIPTKELIKELRRIGIEKKCIFIQLEPNIRKDEGPMMNDKNNLSFILNHLSLRTAAHPLFTKYTLQLDLTKSDDELLKAMHPKARYNIKVAKKHEVEVKEENNKEAFEKYWKLTQETTTRQQFFAHTKNYHLTQWETLPHKAQKNTLSSHLLLATYKKQTLTAWIVFLFKDTLYYPYGASSHEHRETMHSTLMMWEAIQFGKKYKAKIFDLWGAAAPGTPQSDPWFGFTQFKERFGPKRVEFIGSYDLVLNPVLYQFYKAADKIRWLFLRFK